ncbi:metallophosphoesterase [Pseudomonas phage COT4]|uniref:Phosphatase n=1 Tax=Pseudomonas phage M5.1 TaxID=2873460 RepID=A0AAE9BPF3_9CAUD|nr:phosphatase [Pseudomonas phage M5.1]UAV89719.1 phosphatase [Pseudomonas phage M5.1]UAV89989.1 phosphoesterase [Pseudomonas phage REC]UGL61319.1 metallophosphoesterase [Pseudomonas phage COT4]UGL62544.1 hypothetical protein [Pseudomonas phage REC1]
MSRKHIIIADTQCKPDEGLEYMGYIGQYIAEKRPDVVVHIGDHWDFPSLSSYDKGKKVMEGRRVIDDVKAGHDGMAALMQPIKALQEQQRANKKKVYSPKMVFCPGNHEDRFDRYANDNPELYGLVGTDTLKLEQYGWEVAPYLKPVCVDGIYYVHYLVNPMNGRPRAGNAAAQLKAVGSSFVVGHKQVLDIAIADNQLDGKYRIGIINGACYPHDEAYKGHQGNQHFRGIMVLNEVEDGFGLPCPVSLDFLTKKYA